MIDGVIVKPLRQVLDERGKVMHMMRNDDPEFQAFGEIYFSVVNPGAIKGWHVHRRMTLNYAVPLGLIKLVLYDDRPGSSTRGEVMEIFTGPDNYCLIRIPPDVWNGFKGIGTTPALVANCSTTAHDPLEIERLDPHDHSIPYKWERVDR
jgi:dTDP-4-dehydrorhamnose 3,5-epimerase